MKYYLRTILGSLIALCALGVFLYGLFQLVRGGSCASGGNYVSTRPCPAGTTTWMFVLPPALLIGLSGFWLVGRRGPRSAAVPAPVAPSAVFTRPDVFEGFLSGRTPAQSDPIAKLERLRALRDNGALSAEEFERAKQKILTEL